jgi:hypothetical protein
MLEKRIRGGFDEVGFAARLSTLIRLANRGHQFDEQARSDCCCIQRADRTVQVDYSFQVAAAAISLTSQSAKVSQSTAGNPA